MYLNENQVIDEALRFVNISFVSFRQATRDVFVNGALSNTHPSSIQQIGRASCRERVYVLV